MTRSKEEILCDLETLDKAIDMLGMYRYAHPVFEHCYREALTRLLLDLDDEVRYLVICCGGDKEAEARVLRNRLEFMWQS